jgi:photosystem II stability/assembly factor-like uncharacterized protein
MTSLPQTLKTRNRGWTRSTQLLAVTLAFVGMTANASGSQQTSPALPNSPHYHSLLVSPTDPNALLLGTHTGLYASTDGGRHWRFDALKGNDAMNLARPGGNTIWLTGHYVFKKSTDAGATWSNVRPAGLPTLDIHGFAVDPRSANTLYAAVAGVGLFRSTNNGRSFSLVSTKVGGAVMALVVLQDGRILAGDYLRGLMQSSDGGRTWKRVVRAQILGLAINPNDPTRVLATTAGIALSTDAGKNWQLVLILPKGVGPVAWSRSDPTLAYAVGLNRVLYRSTDSGKTWHAVNG